MSIISVRCQRCGGPGVPTGTLGEYNCEHCGTFSELVHPLDGTVINDSKRHFCPMCGRSVKPLKSFKCTECGVVDFCESCVAKVPNFGVVRFVCRDCIHRKGWACEICMDYGASTCVRCGKHACQQHADELFGIIHENNHERIVESYACAQCQGLLCLSCLIQKRGWFSAKYICSHCGNPAFLMASKTQSLDEWGGEQE